MAKIKNKKDIKERAKRSSVEKLSDIFSIVAYLYILFFLHIFHKATLYPSTNTSILLEQLIEAKQLSTSSPVLIKVHVFLKK